MEELYALAFYFKKGIGIKTISNILKNYGSFEIAYKSRQFDLDETIKKAEEELKKAEKENVKIVAITSPDYPKALKSIPAPPPVLYIKGNFKNGNAVSIVGSRKCSSYGRKIAKNLASFLVENGITVVSGLAYGIDTAAHKGAVESKGTTYAVLGCGIDVDYPAGNRSLKEKIVNSGGALISEFPFGTKPAKENFPRRNRIISGLSVATVVIEANENSGALITAQFALEQGREVFSVPGNIDSIFSKGSNKLLKCGATPLVEFEEIFEELPFLKRKTQEKIEIEEDFLPIYNFLLKGDAHLDEIVANVNMPYCEVITKLFEMEAKGVVKSENGKYFLKR